MAVIAALEHRDRTGEGQLVEMPMIEVVAGVTGEQIVEYSAYGALLDRRGEHGVYQCAGEDAWIAVDDANDPMPATERAAWCAAREPAAAVEELRADGVAADVMVPGYLALDDPQLQARAASSSRSSIPSSASTSFPAFRSGSSRVPSETGGRAGRRSSASTPKRC